MKRDEHFTLNLKKYKIELTDAGRQLARYSDPPTGKHAKATDKLLEAVERALHAYYRFARDQHYMVNSEKKIIIIDEGTGRPMPDRHWRDGLHQAVEAKEGVPINMPSEHAAQITFQNFYRLYTKLAGMSGTRPRGSTGSSSGGPAARATPGRPGSSCRSKTNCSKGSGRPGRRNWRRSAAAAATGTGTPTPRSSAWRSGASSGGTTASGST